MNIDTLKTRLTNVFKPKAGLYELDTSSYITDIPKVALDWLFKYGLNLDDVKTAKFMWNPKTESLVMPLFESGKIVVTNERYFGKNKNYAKYITKGNKSQIEKMFCAGDATPHDVVILVEDYVSAYKVAKVNVFVLCLLGSTVSNETLISLSKEFPHLLVWLDFDKVSESIGIAARASQYFKGTCRSIITELDPKEYSYKDIVEKLK